MSTHKTIEPLWWLLFSVGGVVAALLVPVHLFVHALAVPLGWISLSHARMLALVGNPLIKLYVFVLIALPSTTGPIASVSFWRTSACTAGGRRSRSCPTVAPSSARWRRCGSCGGFELKGIVSMADDVDPIVWLLRKFRGQKKTPA